MSLIEKIPADACVVHQAGWVMIDPINWIRDGFVRINAGRILETGQGRGAHPGDRVIHHGTGVLMPALVNAHTHLDLCALHQATDMNAGFIGWVKSVIEQKSRIGQEALDEAARWGAAALKQSGTGVVGDIVSTGASPALFLDSGLAGVRFKEYLGNLFPSELRCEKYNDTQTFSVAGHAPHTTAPDLLVRLKSAANSSATPFSLHLAESLDELEFLTTGKGPWADFLAERGIDTPNRGGSGLGPVQYADRMNLLDQNTLAVHLVFADAKDMALLSEKQVAVCVCPRSNFNLHDHLPGVAMMLRSGLQVCLGTDSLASCDSLNLFDEMAFLANHFPEIAPGDILAMATINGARALGFEGRFGRLSPGSMAAMIYVPISADEPASVMETLVHSGFSKNNQIINESSDKVHHVSGQ